MGTPRNKNDLDRLIIHCAATPNGRYHTAEDIDRWHGERGFARDPDLIGFNQPRLKHIGYHFVIYTTGSVVIGRGLREIGAHAYGYNRQSIGLCLIGTDQFTPAQWDSLEVCVRGLCQTNPALRVVGHNRLSRNKSCPGFDVKRWLIDKCKPLPQNILQEKTSP